ncbi:MAG: MoxR family ATPase [Planctomycetota bacterium]
MSQTAEPFRPEELASLERYAKKLQSLQDHLAEAIVGQETVVRQILAAVLAEGHALLVGVPGLAKTLMVRSLSDLLSLEFRRIQFTPDLMPSDITGATLIREDDQGSRGFHFLRGPIFANILLADEINRTPPKTQAALMEAMEERQITAGGRRIPLDRPFFVLATQNPIEQEGTYPLPVSQLDRFLLEIRVDYPSTDEEFDIVLRTTSTYRAELTPVLEESEAIEILDLVQRVAVSDDLLRYASAIVQRTRPDSDDAPASIKDTVSWGAGPRAVQALIAVGRAGAFLDGRAELQADDLHRMAHAALRHRLVLGYHAEAEGRTTDDLVDDVLESLGRYERPKATEETKVGLLGRLLSKK